MQYRILQDIALKIPSSVAQCGDAEEDEEHLLVAGGRWIQEHPDDG
jgi:hypothetical protein